MTTSTSLLFAVCAILFSPGCICERNHVVEKQKGIVFGSEEWSFPNATFDSAISDQSLRNLAETGASWVRILVTWYVDSVDSPRIYPVVTESSPLFTPTIKQLGHVVDLAHKLGLQVMLSPIVDPNWLLPQNCRSNTSVQTVSLNYYILYVNV